MEKFDSLTLVITSENDNTFSPEKDSAHFDQSTVPQSEPRLKGTISWQTFIIIILLIMHLMNVVQTYQYKQYSKVVTQEAYVLSVSINLLEDCLLMNYGLFPEDFAYFDENIAYLRDAWISDANRDTANAYYEALSNLYEFFECEQDIEPTDTIELIFV